MSQITTHILDTASGRPAAGVPLELAQRDGETWRTMAAGTTDADGRVADLLGEEALPAGTYRMHFDTGQYFRGRGSEGFYPWVDVVFDVAAGGEHYHIPLLLSPFGYSTYRGS